MTVNTILVRTRYGYQLTGKQKYKQRHAAVAGDGQQVQRGQRGWWGQRGQRGWWGRH